jgi:hypothetical protein
MNYGTRISAAVAVLALFCVVSPATTQLHAAAAIDYNPLLGGYIVASDGQYLGKITTSTVDAKSLLNTVGNYGSTVSATSIFNTVGTYGGTVSAQSPFNTVSFTPPLVYKKDGTFVGYLTVNTTKVPRIDPNALVGWLKNQ